MVHTPKRLGLALAAGLAALAIGTAAATPSGAIGPSTATTPYIVASQPGVVLKSVLTVGDSVNAKPNGEPYRLVGIPDGMGAFDNKDGSFTLLMNHELRAGLGATRAHGANGAFVSKWTIRKRDLAVLKGEDLIQQVVTWNTATSSYNPPAAGVPFSRFCSANLPARGAFYHDGVGYNGRIFMNGEENGPEGRAFAHLLDGTSYELPRLGKFSWENALANPDTGKKTVVIGTDDGTGGQLYVYIGKKTNSGSPVDRAGLTNGILYGVKVTGFADENPDTGIPSGTKFTLISLGNVENLTGAQLDAASDAAGITHFQRPEDAEWDPRNSDDFYFATTASFIGQSRLWRLDFKDIERPEIGGKIELLLDGSEGPKMMDNLTVNRRGQVIIQEDPGNQSYIAKIWRYDIARDRLTEIAQHDPARFTPGAPGFLTQDEESSGVIDVSSILGQGWYLLAVQAHYATDAELVEGGQLLALRVPPK
ncbi:MAG: DUF839 domain-containing protein [Kouleothrix sp.]